MIEIYKTFTFDSAHWLPHVSDDHKCKHMHGHTYHLKIWLKGELSKEEGWVLDFGDIKSIVTPLIDLVDHKVLNDIEGLENPTCEIFCIWWYDRLIEAIPELYKVELAETPTSGASYAPIR